MDKVLTISIAAYNVEKFLENTLDSFIIDDKYMDLIDVIVVSDGSEDGTVGIARQYVDKYPGTFRLIDKENGGYGSTINTSIPIAKGKYYKLVDGDDWVEKTGLVQLIDYLQATCVDAVLTKYCSVMEGTGKKEVVDENIIFDNLPHDVDCLYGHFLPMHFLAIRTDLLKNNGIHITEKCFYTDLEYVIKPLPYINRVALLDAVVYMYRIGRDEQSVSIKNWQKNIEQAVKVTYELASYYNNLEKEKIDKNKLIYIQEKVVDSAINKYRIFLSFKSGCAIKKKIRDYDNQLRNISIKISNLCRKNNMVRLLLLPGMPLYPLISNVYRGHLKKKGML